MSLTTKQEKFCTLVVELGNASEAYRQAYAAGKMTPNAIAVEASKMIATPKISLRISQLKAEHAERHAVTVDTIRDMLMEDRKFARECETPAAAVSATMGLAKLYGHLTDKIDHRSSDGTMTPREPTYRLVPVTPGDLSPK